MIARLAVPLTMLALAGCAAALDRPPPGTPPVLAWAPQAAPPRAVIVALHGSNDHKGSFEAFGRAAAEAGLLVRAYDHPGFGEQADRGAWPGNERLVAVLDEQIEAARAAAPGAPVFVLGESMGAAVAAVALAANRPDGPLRDVAGIILSAPAVWGGETLAWRYRLALRLARAVAPNTRLTGRGLKLQASDDIAMLRALGRDPLYLRGATIGAIAGLVDLMDAARASAPALRLPVLVLIGARDEIVPPSAQESFARVIGAADCTLVYYPEGWHLLLRDLQRPRVFADILAWIDGAPLPSHLARPCRLPEGAAADARAPAAASAPGTRGRGSMPVGAAPTG